MKKLINQNAFTLAEILIALGISAVIAIFMIKGISTSNRHYTNSLLTYSAFDSLTNAAFDMVTVGCSAYDRATDAAMTPPRPYCSALTGVLPAYRHTSETFSATTVPRGLCDRLATDYFNTVNAVDCTLTATDSGSFAAANANFTTTNGMRFFNFGSPAAGQTAVTTSYRVYVDIDGPSRSARRTETVTGRGDADIMTFLIGINGNVIPEADSVAANSADYLSASVRYLNTTTNQYVYVVAGVPYRTAICGATPSTTRAAEALALDSTYCSAHTIYNTAITQTTAGTSAICSPTATTGAQTCEVELIKPGLLQK